MRDQTFWTAKSAMSMAMTLQRENGPDGCYPGPYAFTLNGFTANVTCTPTGNYFGTGRGRFALITTGNDFEHAATRREWSRRDRQADRR